jgi:hypothetical protein
MSVITLEADATTLTLNGYAFSHLIAGDVLELAPVNELTAHVNSSNGGLNVQKRVDGDVHDLTVRVQRFSPDDVFLNSMINRAAPVLFSGSVKTALIRDNVAAVDSWSLENGSITARPTMTHNDQDGNAMSEYKFRFRTAVRSM